MDARQTQSAFLGARRNGRWKNHGHELTELGASRPAARRCPEDERARKRNYSPAPAHARLLAQCATSIGQKLRRSIAEWSVGWRVQHRCQSRQITRGFMS